MILTFHGVRGSIATPGPDTVRYGGNTSCVHVGLSDGRDFLFDAGTGIRLAGRDLARRDGPIFIALTHQHWDHIQGYPFFAPVYQPEREIKVFTVMPSTHQVLCELFEQMDGFNFPVRAEDLPSNGECIYEQPDAYLRRRDIEVSTIPLNHPGGGTGFRLTDDDVTIAYITDNELDPPAAPRTNYDRFVEFVRGVDVLIHDAQYTESDMPHKHGWGHSLISQVRQLAVDAEVGSLVLFHHDPERTDAQLDEIQRENDVWFKGRGTSLRSFCAWEGMRLKPGRTSNGRTVLELL